MQSFLSNNFFSNQSYTERNWKKKAFKERCGPMDYKGRVDRATYDEAR